MRPILSRFWRFRVEDMYDKHYDFCVKVSTYIFGVEKPSAFLQDVNYTIFSYPCLNDYVETLKI